MEPHRVAGRDQAIAKLKELGIPVIEADGLTPYTMDTIMSVRFLDVEPFEHSTGPCGAALVGPAPVFQDKPGPDVWWTFVCTNPRAHEMRAG